MADLFVTFLKSIKQILERGDRRPEGPVELHRRSPVQYDDYPHVRTDYRTASLSVLEERVTK